MSVQSSGDKIDFRNKKGLTLEGVEPPSIEIVPNTLWNDDRFWEDSPYIWDDDKGKQLP